MTIPKRLVITADGGSRGNPGKAACAFVVWDEVGTQLYGQGVFLGVTTNNQAEYKALLFSLQWLAKQETKPDFVTWKMDSLLVVEQMLGHWKVKNLQMQILRDKCREQLAILFPEHNYDFCHVAREYNATADALVNQTLDAHS